MERLFTMKNLKETLALHFDMETELFLLHALHGS